MAFKKCLPSLSIPYTLLPLWQLIKTGIRKRNGGWVGSGRPFTIRKEYIMYPVNNFSLVATIGLVNPNRLTLLAITKIMTFSCF